MWLCSVHTQYLDTHPLAVTSTVTNSLGASLNLLPSILSHCVSGMEEFYSLVFAFTSTDYMTSYSKAKHSIIYRKIRGFFFPTRDGRYAILWPASPPSSVLRLWLETRRAVVVVEGRDFKSLESPARLYTYSCQSLQVDWDLPQNHPREWSVGK